jgi:phosphate transport system substrate-binding protein
MNLIALLKKTGTILPALMLVASPLASHAAGQKLVLTGSSTIAPLVAEVGKRFEKQNPGVRVDVQTGGRALDAGTFSAPFQAQEQ